MRKYLAALVFVVASLVAIQAGASVVTSIPGGTVIPMPAVNYFGGGPMTFGPSVTWSSTNDGTQASAQCLASPAVISLAATALGQALSGRWRA